MHSTPVDFRGSLGSSRKVRSIAIAHMVINLSLVVLLIFAADLMWNDGVLEAGRHNLVLALHGIDTVMLCVSGWLGGEMVYKHHVGVPPMEMDVRRTGLDDVGCPRPMA